MSSIDSRIVQMKFDNQNFESGVKTTMNSLQSLNEKLKMKGSTDGLSNVNNALKNFSVAGISGMKAGLDTVTSKFTALEIMGMTALANLTNSAINTGKVFVRSLTVDPVKMGFNEYETKMNSIQTILTNTASKGTTMEDVTKTLDELNQYADKTIYNFAEMTKNIGTFTAAGIGLETSATAIKGIANLAAGSGSTSSQASTVMYQLSQALAAGRVGLQDWNSVVNAGMGGELFQNALKEQAKSMGIYVDESKPFRETLKDNWLTSDVLIKTLEKFANDESLLKAATEVKTFSQLMDTMKESVQSGWATSWEYIIGNKEQAAELFTSISDGFNAIIKPSTDARNAMLKFWNENGGRTAVIEGLSNIMQSLGKVLGTIKEAWEEVFPPMTGEKLVDLSNKFKSLTEKFKMGDDTIAKIKTTFKGLFDIIPLITNAFVSFKNGIKPLMKIFDGMGTKILDITSKFGQFITDLKDSANEMGFFETISSKLSSTFESIATFIIRLKDNIKGLIENIKSLNFKPIFEAIGGGFKGIYNLLKPIFTNIGKLIGKIDMNTVLDTVKTGALVKIVTNLKKMFDSISDVGESASGFLGSLSGLGGQIKDTLSAVKDTLQAYQEDLKASTLIKIATAIAVLAGALLVIASIDGEQLIKGLAGLAVVFGELVGAYGLMMKVGGLRAPVKMGTFLVTFATAALILAAALKKLSDLEPDELMTGMLGLVTVIGLMAASAKILSKNSGKMVSTATGLVIFGAALHIMAGALEKMGSIDAYVMGAGLSAVGILLGELAIFLAAAKFGKLSITSATGVVILSAALLILQKSVEGFGNIDPDIIKTGLVAIGGILAEIALFSKFSSSGTKMVGVGIGLTLIADALIILGDAVKSFSGMSWEEIGRGLTVMGGGLLIIGAASKLISGVKMTGVAIGIGAMSIALSLLGLSLKAFSGMSWEEIGKGITVLAGSLTILAVAMFAMSGTIAGAAAMVIAAGALAILTPQLLMLSAMDLSGVGIALLAMAGAFTVLGLAGLILGPLVPVLLGLGGAIALIGVGALACGAGLTMVGAGLTAIGVAVGGSGLLIVEFLRQLINLLPQLGTKAGEAIVNFVKAIGDGSTQIVASLTQLGSQMITALTTLIPQFVTLAVTIVVEFAKGLATCIPVLVDCGLKMITGILEGIANNIGGIIEAGANCVINFLNGVAEKLPEIIEAGINLAISFIQGVADGLINNKDRMATAIEDVIYAMITTGIEVLVGAVSGFVKGGADLLQGAIDGIKEKWPDIKDAVKGAADNAVNAVTDWGSKLLQAGKDLIQGFMDGIKSKAQDVWDAATGVAEKAVSAVKSFLGIASPSKVFRQIGRWSSEGMAIGLDRYAYLAENSASNLANNIVDNVRNPLSNMQNLLDGEMNVDPTITPVLDLSKVQNGSRLINDMIGNQDVQINTRSMAGTIGNVRSRNDNSDVISALNGLKDQLNNTSGPSYTINGITYDDGSNVASAVQTLVRAAKIERRL